MNLPANTVPHPDSALLMQLNHLGLLIVSGNDAADFLHNQLTNDVLKLTSDFARLAGYCSPKGRLLADFLIWKNADHIGLQCSIDILSGVQKRLSMFVLRAKAKVEDANSRMQTFGLVGQGAQTVLRSQFDALPEEVWSKLETERGTLIRVPDSMNLPRWLWLMPSEQAENIVAKLKLPQADSSLWQWLDIRAALPRITAATQDRFVPQMINFEAIGGVNFKKGCYPGQEVVARSQYLGKLKRRMTVAHCASATEAQAGEDVFVIGKPDEPVGTIVNSAAAPEGGVDLLLELPSALLSEPASMQASLQSKDGSEITLLALPYVLPDQDIFVRPKL